MADPQFFSLTKPPYYFQDSCLYTMYSGESPERVRKECGKMIDFYLTKVILVRELELITREKNWKQENIWEDFSVLQARNGTILN